MLSDGYSKGLLLNILRIFGTIVNTPDVAAPWAPVNQGEAGTVALLTDRKYSE